jgi:AraC-like DNA-binding protein
MRAAKPRAAGAAEAPTTRDAQDRTRSFERLPMPMAYFWLLLREFGGAPEAEAALLAGTGVEPAARQDPAAEGTLGQTLALIRNLHARREPGWALTGGSAFHASTHGPLGFAAVSAPTLGDALDVIERYGWVRAPYFRTRSERTDRLYHLTLEERVPLADVERVALLEALWLSLQALLESVRGRPVREARFEFAYPEPAYAARYGEHFHGEVRFGRPETRVSLPAAWLALPSPMADAATFASAVAKLDAQARRIEGADFLVARLEQLFESAGDAGLSLDAAARQLRLSRRTLNRRLAECDTSFREQLERHRMARARALLADASLAVGEIAWRLGYEDPSNFGRACRRWFGAPPAEVRRTLAKG